MCLGNNYSVFTLFLKKCLCDVTGGHCDATVIGIVRAHKKNISPPEVTFGIILMRMGSFGVVLKVPECNADICLD